MTRPAAARAAAVLGRLGADGDRRRAERRGAAVRARARSRGPRPARPGARRRERMSLEACRLHRPPGRPRPRVAGAARRRGRPARARARHLDARAACRRSVGRRRPAAHAAPTLPTVVLRPPGHRATLDRHRVPARRDGPVGGLGAAGGPAGRRALHWCDALRPAATTEEAGMPTPGAGARARPSTMQLPADRGSRRPPPAAASRAPPSAPAGCRRVTRSARGSTHLLLRPGRRPVRRARAGAAVARTTARRLRLGVGHAPPVRTRRGSRGRRRRRPVCALLAAHVVAGLRVRRARADPFRAIRRDTLQDDAADDDIDPYCAGAVRPRPGGVVAAVDPLPLEAPSTVALSITPRPRSTRAPVRRRAPREPLAVAACWPARCPAARCRGRRRAAGGHRQRATWSGGEGRAEARDEGEPGRGRARPAAARAGGKAGTATLARARVAAGRGPRAADLAEQRAATGAPTNSFTGFVASSHRSRSPTSSPVLLDRASGPTPSSTRARQRRYLEEVRDATVRRPGPGPRRPARPRRRPTRRPRVPGGRRRAGAPARRPTSRPCRRSPARPRQAAVGVGQAGTGRGRARRAARRRAAARAAGHRGGASPQAAEAAAARPLRPRPRPSARPRPPRRPRARPGRGGPPR